jgi:SAM-dependent methyltransferase
VEVPKGFRGVFASEPNSVSVVKGRVNGKECEVPSFVSAQHYADNFSKQWSRFRDSQLDSVNGTSISRDYLEQLIGQPLESLAGKTILEVGAGAGRFTEHLIRYGSVVVAIDLSEAIFVNAALGADCVVPAQADLLQMPRMKLKFDLVFCRGMLQHTPDPAKGIELIHGWAAPGGIVAFDIYAPGRLGRLNAKYLLRPIIQRLFTFDSLSRFLERYAEPMLRTRWRLTPFLPGRSRGLLDYVLPIYDYRGGLPLSEEQLVEWGKLDTLDAMFARYDNPMKYEDVMEILGTLGCRVLWADRTLNFFRTTIPKDFSEQRTS